MFVTVLLLNSLKYLIIPFFAYCKNGKSKQLEEILEESDSDLDLNEGDYDNRRPLHIAVEEEKIECIKIPNDAIDAKAAKTLI